ncbi:MAG: ADP-ribosylglycohydrolase family protein [Chloroflexi bacterium]|nr:ADP-ribosylglycohydrolase family protein [Chloroflexota bacterium]
MTQATETTAAPEILARAQGCLLGQFAGEMLGMPVEGMQSDDLRQLYPDGLTLISDGKTALLPLGMNDSQPALAQLTDDGEMAIMLARTLAEQGKFEADAVLDAYKFWWNSPAFGYGPTAQNALERGYLDPDSQSNGGLMRISPLGIFGVNHDPAQVADWARQDSRLTHIHPVCQDSVAVFTVSIARAIRTGCDGAALHRWIIDWAAESGIADSVIDALRHARDRKPFYPTDIGASDKPFNIPLRLWVLVALHNAFWQLLNADSLEAGVVDTVMLGDDTDTTAAICGALMGAVYGREAVPAQWSDAVLNCRPHAEQPHVFKPRPDVFWPIDALELAERLVSA